MTELGPLGPLDETFGHQIVETFATRRAGRPVVDREGVRDGRAATARSSSRSGWASTRTATCSTRTPACRAAASSGRCARAGELAPDVEPTGGRTDPLRRARAASARAVPLDAERRAADRRSSGSSRRRCRPCSRTRGAPPRRDVRLDADIVRYHQIGTALGLGRGRRRAHEITDDDVGLDARPLVGRALRGRRAARRRRAGARPDERRDDGLSWPMLLERPDGTPLRDAHQYQRHGFGDGERSSSRAGSSIPTAGASRSPRSCPKLASTRATGACSAARCTPR